MLRTLSLVSLALAALAFTPSTALAQNNGERVAQAYIDRIEATADRHQSVTRATAERAVDAIADLAADDAPDRAIIAAGASATKAINAEARRASERVASLRKGGVAALRRLDAPAALIARVVDAAHSAQDSISTTAERGRSVVRAAVERALDR